MDYYVINSMDIGAAGSP